MYFDSYSDQLITNFINNMAKINIKLFRIRIVLATVRINMGIDRVVMGGMQRRI